jgi:hypothetical protein
MWAITIIEVAVETNQSNSLMSDSKRAANQFATSAKLKSEKAQIRRLFHPTHRCLRSFLEVKLQDFQANPNQSTAARGLSAKGSPMNAFDANSDSTEE